jgi:hypothetical protein
MNVFDLERPDINKKTFPKTAVPVKNYPFFIFSCGRSGSSLLSRMLNKHPRIAVPYESHLFNTFYPWLKYYGDLTNPRNRERLVNDILSTDVLQDWSPQVDLRKVLSLIRVHNFGGIVDAILQSWAESLNKSRWGEKTPKHLFYWREIHEYFPKAKFIHIVRDGRDVSISWIKARFGPKTIYSAAKQWDSYLKVIEGFRNSICSQTFYEIHYEDLLENPEKILSEICNFLGETFDSKMLEFYKEQTSYRTDETNLRNLSKPLLRDNKQKWRTYMTFDDLRVFEAVAQKTLVRCGYEAAIENPTLSKSEVVYRRFVESPSRKLIAMAKNRKGHVDAFVRLKLMLRLILIDQFLYR